MSNKVETYTFLDLKKTFVKRFKGLSKDILFYVGIDREKIWEEYLSGFSEEFKQEHNCNCCKSFLRQFGGLVIIKENKIVSIWDDIETSEVYKKAIENVRNYIHSLPITDIFLTTDTNCGTDNNFDVKKSITWNHFYLSVPNTYLVKGKDLGTNLGTARTDKEVLKRSLDEFTIDATETVLELIAQNSLYKGKEFEAILKRFLLIQRQYSRVLPSNQDNFCWVTSQDPKNKVVNRMKNISIGNLLIGISAGLDLEDCVKEFESMVGATNYKRPTALVSPKMVENAKKEIEELGLLEALNRRYANETDLSIKDVLFTDKSSNITDVFGEITKETLVNPRTLSKVEEIGIEDFIKNVVPNASSISVLLENHHLSNMVSLLTSQDRETPHLFKWDNNFSWNYTGAITDSIKERVKQAGGNVVGELRASLSWFNYDDLDLHAIEPNGNRICFNRKMNSQTSGHLDVDMNISPTTRKAVENIIWTNKNSMLEGDYRIEVNNYTHREIKDTGFIVQMECQGETFDFEFKTNPRNGATQVVAEFTYSKTKGITFKGEVKSNVVSKEKWGLKTNVFHKVNKFMLSPNYWGEKGTGNKHYLFMLENCLSDESPRPFFNEFLKQELDVHRKVFEVLGSKIKVEDSNNQLSGLGFSDTQRNHVIVKVTGKFTRTLKVNI